MLFPVSLRPQQKYPTMVKAGYYNYLPIVRFASVGAYLDDDDKGLLLPKRFVPNNAQPGDILKVFVYHDGEDRLIATTDTPHGIAGEIVQLKCVDTTKAGAFLDNGLMKDLFVPVSQQQVRMFKGVDYIVKIYIDERTGRMAATQKFDHQLSNDKLTVKELEVVDLFVYRKTDIGYAMIINNRHIGLLHFNEVYRPIEAGDRFEGFIKKIHEEDNKIDVAAGKPGYARVEDETEKILRLLHENNGYLPYYDKSSPEEIYEFFAMSKKTFKMTVGALYKQQKISLEKTGIRSVK
jgi:uncharacterized protein